MKRPTGGAAVVVVLVVVLAVLPLLYVLSIGPAIWLHSTGAIGPSGERVLEVVYAPLAWVANGVPVVGPCIMWYAELWRRQQVVMPTPPVSPPTPSLPPPPPGALPSPTPAPAGS